MATQVESIKWVPGTNFIVDGFAFTSPKCKHYFLTHAHSDHTIGLRKSFNAGLIHCSHVTARLLIHDMGVRPEVVRPLEVGVPVVVAGVRVTPLDANHCPGSVMFLFEVPIRDRDRAGGSGPGAGSGAGQQQAAGSVGVKAEEATGLKIEAAVGLEAAVLVKPELGEVGVGEEEEAAGSLAAELGMAEAAVAGQHLQEAQGACSCQGGGGDASREDGGDEEDDEAARGVELEAGCQQLMALAAADAGAAGAAAGGTQQGWGMAVGTPEGLPGSEALLRGARAAAAGPQATGGEGAGCPSGWGTIGAGASGSGECTGAWCGGVATHNVLHTGDMRWQRWMRDQPGLAGVRVDTLFLDTTYALPRHRLPPQEEAIAMMVQAMREAQAEEAATLFVVAAYHIGKERAFLGAAQQLGTKVWATPDKRKVLALLGLAPEQAGLLVERPEEADIHVGGWGLRHEDLQAYMASHKGSRWKRVVGIRPTGWTFRRKGGVSVWREGDVSILGVPYSEHSSWTDLCDAVSQLRPRRVVPTVNAATPAHRRSLVDRFAHLMDLSTDRSRLDVYLARAAELQRVKSEAGEQPSSAGTCAATGTATATAAAGAVAGAVCRVDLAAVDVGEQERILAQVQEQHRRRQAMQQRRAQLQQAQQERRRAAAQERKGKARKRGRAEDGSPAEEAEAEGKATSGRRGGEEAAVGSAACGQQRPQRRRQSSSAPPRGSQGGGTPLQPAAAASAAERTPAPLLRRSSCGRAARGACVVDLSIDSDDGADEQEEDQEEDQEDQGRSTSRAGLSSGGFTAAAHGSIRRFLASRAVAEEEAQHQ